MADYQLEIHHIDVRGGDATLILCRNITTDKNEYAILVDTGSEFNGWKNLKLYLEEYYSELIINLLIVSHYHEDHYKGITQGNLLDTLKVETICDIGELTDTCYPINTKVYDEIKGNKQPPILRNYIKKVNKNHKSKRLVLPFINKENYNLEGVYLESKEPKNIAIGSGTGYYIEFLSAKGMLFDGENIIKNQRDYNRLKVDANDLSISFIIYHEKNEVINFTYFSGGDLSGDSTLLEYYNLEGPLFDRIKKIEKYSKGIKVVKAMHHGSDRNNHVKNSDLKNSKIYPITNTAPGFFETFMPEVIIVPSNKNKQVPGVDYVGKRLTNYQKWKVDSWVFFLNDTKYSKSIKEEKRFYKAYVDFATTNPNRSNIVVRKNLESTDLDQPTTAIIVVTASDYLKMKKPYVLDELEEKLNKTNYKIYSNHKKLDGFVESTYKDESYGDASLPDEITKEIGDAIFENFSKQPIIFIQFFSNYFDENGKPTEVFLKNKTLFLANYPSFKDFIDKIVDKNYFEQLKENDWTEVMKKMVYNLYIFKDWPYETWYIKDITEKLVNDQTTLCNLLEKNPIQLEYNIRFSGNKTAYADLAQLDLSNFDIRNKDKLKKEIGEILTNIRRIRKTNKRSHKFEEAVEEIANKYFKTEENN